MDHFDSLGSSSVSQMHDMFLPPRLAHSLKILRLVLNKNLQGKNAKKKKKDRELARVWTYASHFSW